jgi:hypothetical protein
MGKISQSHRLKHRSELIIEPKLGTEPDKGIAELLGDRIMTFHNTSFNS